MQGKQGKVREPYPSQITRLPGKGEGAGGPGKGGRMEARIIIKKKNGEHLLTIATYVGTNGNGLELRDRQYRIINTEVKTSICGQLQLILTVRNRTKVQENPILNSLIFKYSGSQS